MNNKIKLLLSFLIISLPNSTLGQLANSSNKKQLENIYKYLSRSNLDLSDKTIPNLSKQDQEKLIQMLIARNKDILVKLTAPAGLPSLELGVAIKLTDNNELVGLCFGRNDETRSYDNYAHDSRFVLSPDSKYIFYNANADENTMFNVLYRLKDNKGVNDNLIGDLKASRYGIYGDFEDTVKSIVFNSENNIVIMATCDATNSIFIFSLFNEKYEEYCRLHFNSDNSRQVFLAQNNKTLFVTSRQNPILVYDINNLKDPSLVNKIDENSGGMAISHNNKFAVILLTNGCAKIFNIENPKDIKFVSEISCNNEDRYFENKICLSQNSNLLLISLANGSVKLFDIDDIQRPKELLEIANKIAETDDVNLINIGFLSNNYFFVSYNIFRNNLDTLENYSDLWRIYDGKIFKCSQLPEIVNHNSKHIICVKSENYQKNWGIKDQYINSNFSIIDFSKLWIIDDLNLTQILFLLKLSKIQDQSDICEFIKNKKIFESLNNNLQKHLLNPRLIKFFNRLTGICIDNLKLVSDYYF